MAHHRTDSSPRYFASAADFRDWLEAHSATATELLVGFYKVDAGRASMRWSESVDEALCVGWIDGVRRRIDDMAYSIRFTPRRPESVWSAINIAKVAELRAQGRMRPAGEAAFARRSEARSKVYSHERLSAAELSPEERQVFAAQAEAWQYFESTPPGYRRVVLHWITSAKKVDTRAARLAKLMAACAIGQRLK